MSEPVEVQDIVQDAQELVEDSVTFAEEKVSWIRSNPRALVVVASLTGLAIGGALGYLIASKRLSVKYQAIADEQVAEVKERYAHRLEKPDLAKLAEQYPDEEPADPEQEIRRVADEIVNREGYRAYNKVEQSPAAPIAVERDHASTPPADVVRNIFASDDPDTYFDPEEEAQRRLENPDDPYVITFDEFNQNENDWDQVSVTYYDGDEVLVDDKDVIIDDENGTVGTSNLLRFGAASKDRNVVYVQNNRLEVLFEVIRNDSSYSESVLGFIKHSDKSSGLRRFRDRE